jgi:hypothetical protein
MRYPESLDNFIKIDIAKSQIVVLLSILMSFVAVSQNRQFKTDSLRINDSIFGKASFNYINVNGALTYDGEFQFQSIEPLDLENFDFKAIGYEGIYKSDVKNGSWEFFDKKLKVLKENYVSDFKIGQLASGIERRISGQFLDGMANGNWYAIQQNFVKSKPEDTLHSVLATFKTNTLIGVFEAKSKTISASGFLNAEGYFHGKWQIILTDKTPEIKVIRVYDAGVLKEYQVEVESEIFQIYYPALENDVKDSSGWIDLTIVDGYFDILNLIQVDIKETIPYPLYSRIEKAHQETNSFLEKSILALSYDKDFDVWSNLKGSSPLNLGIFKVKKLPFSEEELLQIKAISKGYSKSKEIIDRFLDNPKVEIGKSVYEDFDRIDLIYKIYKDKLKQLDKIVVTVSSPGFEYVDRDKILVNLKPYLKFPVEISYDFQNQIITKTHSFPTLSSETDFNLNSTEELMSAIVLDIERLKAESDRVLRSMEIEKSLSSDEAKMVKAKETLEKRFKGKEEKLPYNSYHKRFSELVLNLSQQKLAAYGKLSIQDKKKEIKELLNCFRNFLDFYDLLLDMEIRDSRLDDAYTRTMFNPYMMVDMSERIKERIYEAYTDVLRPYLLGRLENNLSCETIVPALEEFGNIYSRMIELSKKDTREEERKLKRERNPQRIMAVLNLKFKY